MTIRIAAAIFCAGGIFAQPTLPQAVRTIELDPARPKEVVAILDGQNVTAEEFQQFVVSMDPKAREAARNNAEEILRYVGWLRRIGAEAEKRGISAQPRIQLQLEMARIQLLSSAVIQQHEQDEIVTPFEQRGYYQANQPLYSGVKLKLIYLPFSTETEELQAKRKAEEIHKKLAAGADFVAMVKEYSKDKDSREKDGDYGEVRMGDAIPQLVKDVAYKLKDGEISGPTRLPNGYYIFKRTGLNVDPFDKVKDQIFVEIKQKRNLDWVAKNRDAVQLKLASPSKSTDPNRVIATLEGQPVTAAQVDEFVGAMDEKLRKNLRDNPDELLRGIGFMRRMTKLAEEKKLHEASPYKMQLELTRLQALTNALMQTLDKDAPLSEAEIMQGYRDNLKYLSLAKVKIIFFSVAGQSEAENQAALQLAKEVHEKIKAGSDFVEMVKQYSKDQTSRNKNGDYGTVKITDPEVPPPAKQAIWTMNVGDVSAPVRLPNGYYIFKLMALEEPGLEAVREELTKRLRAAKGRQMLAAMRAQVQVQVLQKKTEAAR